MLECTTKPPPAQQSVGKKGLPPRGKCHISYRTEAKSISRRIGTKKQYDVLVIGPVSLDHNIDYLGNERREVGGAVVASGFAAARSGNATALFTKLNPADADVEERFRGSGADLYWKTSKATCLKRYEGDGICRLPASLVL